MIELVLFENAIDRGERGKERIPFFPLTVKDGQRDARLGLNLLDDEFSLVSRTLSKLAAIGTTLGMKRGEASFFVGIPPILQSSGG